MSSQSTGEPHIRSKLEDLLATTSATGSFASGGSGKLVLPSIVLNLTPPPAYDESEIPAKRARRSASSSSSSITIPLQFLIDNATKTKIIAVANAAGIGGPGAQPGGSIVNLEVRKTWQILPLQMSITNFPPPP